ncbi:LapA family protein [Corynebacterium pacaense]|uniref:LapA family protein n=1 Tax=Corynebacterium pacaense TaxID=1816684 RepID=UPI001FE96FF8|nr:lipopolysaccharide assembly protein LapA domain-containing protein [Corynebacterium pacaense]
MSNQPQSPNDAFPEDTHAGYDPGIPGAGDVSDPADDAPGTRSEVTAPVPAVRDEKVHDVEEQHREAPRTPSRTFAGGTWVALIVGALLLILLLVFILQNQTPVELTLFAWSFQFPAGIGFLLAAITGALIMALVGGVRMFEYRRQIRKLRKAF